MRCSLRDAGELLEPQRNPQDAPAEPSRATSSMATTTTSSMIYLLA